ncbi:MULTISPECIES: sugar transferase [unclassified Butyrivibrio]|uniref:sugar transferase n=1 Tax=unclassified Butyrivibrio TaxID=2639466 RepID=UPI0003B5C5FB|nr:MULTISPECIES: sugar transferase [unclassified Butyrivibrio]SEL82725.1 Sugar transferase involved in LPS biosynthesis (colanic, teichoic acid) [Butyrivibrio sp. ob235]
MTNSVKKGRQGIYSLFIKRLIDIILSLLVLVCFSWLYLILAILVRVKLGSPVIFKQPRPGKDEKVFNLYKFRTMTDKRDENGNLLPDEDRLPEFGKKLRATSLDELPEFINILKGDMSFVGPRPLLVKYLPLYNEEQKRRHDVRPGLTGWAQVNGRNLLSWEDRFEKDVYYVDHLSFLMDLKIVFMTVAVVFKHDDINSATDATMEAFTGTPPKKEE